MGGQISAAFPRLLAAEVQGTGAALALPRGPGLAQDAVAVGGDAPVEQVAQLPEAGQGPAVGSATFTGLTLSNNFQDIRNTTSTFTIVRN